MPTESSARIGGSVTVAPTIPGVGTIGFSATVYPGNYGIADQPTFTLTGILGGTFSGPTAGIGHPFSIEGVFLTPGTTAADTLGPGYTGNISVTPASATLDYGVNGQLLAVQGGVAFGFMHFEPGMAVTAEIKTGQRRVISYLLSPLMRYRDEAGRER